MKIRNLVFATAGAASLALALSACNEPTGNNSANNKPVNLSTPANTVTPANLTPANTNANANHGTNTAPMNTKPIDNKPMNTNMNKKP